MNITHPFQKGDYVGYYVNEIKTILGFQQIISTFRKGKIKEIISKDNVFLYIVEGLAAPRSAETLILIEQKFDIENFEKIYDEMILNNKT